MKRIKQLVFIGIILLVILMISVFVIRRPSYTIQTNGKLYVVNKLSSSITVFDLFKGKEVTKFPIDVLPHEVTTLDNQDRVVITNYGSLNVDNIR